MAVGGRRPVAGLGIPSDRGVPYTAISFGKLPRRRVAIVLDGKDRDRPGRAPWRRASSPLEDRSCASTRFPDRVSARVPSPEYLEGSTTTRLHSALSYPSCRLEEATWTERPWRSATLHINRVIHLPSM